MIRGIDVFCIFLFASGCSPEPVADGRIRVDAEWPAVSQMLGARCGSLDCHGHAGRPLRLYHGQGLRLSVDDRPGQGATTADEHAANLRAAVGLEPELTAQVMGEDGADPERLTLFRKALGIEAHKGNTARDDDVEACLRGWLASAIDVEVCARAEERERP